MYATFKLLIYFDKTLAIQIIQFMEKDCHISKLTGEMYS